jgi:ATP-dependent Lon protease
MNQDSRAITPEAEATNPADNAPISLPVGGTPIQDSTPVIPDRIPLLPIRNSVVFPGTVMPLGVNREKSKRLMDAVLASESKMLAVVTQKSADIENPTFEDIYRTGVACIVMKLLRMRDGSQNAIINGLIRVRVEELIQTEPYWIARISVIRPEVNDDNELKAMIHSVRSGSQRVIELSPNIPDEAITVLNSIDDPSALADFVAANMAESIEERQGLLETADVMARLKKVNDSLIRRIDVLEMSKKIQDQARSQIEKAQREYFLQEQLKAIQKELGEQDSRQAEMEDLRKRVKEAHMPAEVQAEVDRQLERLERLPQASPEYSVSRDHIEWLISLPWAVSTEDNLDINRAAEILDQDHYDLERVKKRILEFLAVRKLQPTGRGPILCLLGPPGVGKTSLGQSIARALGRKFIRMSLGGIRDEADIRGHRRTYIGAMPGRIIQEIRTAGSNNAVFMLDEVDKIGADFRGDPAAALLEVLDPEQNRNFVDHYLGVAFDLSKVLFIGTANWMDPIPAPLRDRMEVIDVPGYTIIEKVKIARRYLIPRQVSQNGLKAEQLDLTDEALDDIIGSYTREAGVRNLEREVAAVCRVAAADIARNGPRFHKVTRQSLPDYLGPAKVVQETALRAGVPGVVTGMAYTPSGGEIIFIEATAMPGNGSLTLTGQIGNVMRESAQAAFSLVRSRAKAYLGKSGPNGLRKQDIHIHVPAGAVPKDGPSAGVAMFTALVSLLTNKPSRADLAMTGEITLRGIVLPIGGVKEKVLAAHRAGIRTVILPKQNEKDLADVHEEVRKQMRFHFVDNVDEVIKIALGKPPREVAKPRAKGPAMEKKPSLRRQGNLAKARAAKRPVAKTRRR